MFKIQVINNISAAGLAQFAANTYHIAADIENPDAVLVRSADLHQMTLAKSVKVIGRAGAGVNNIPVAELTKQGIPVLNTPGANANAVKELVIAGMLLACRNLCPAWNYIQNLPNNTVDLDKEIEQNKKRFVGFELPGKTLGVIGLGNIGVQVANTAAALGMRVIGYDPSITVKHAWKLSANVEQAHNIDNLLAQADFITLHIPLIADTKNLINAARFNLLRKGAVLLNFSRNGLIDNTALQEALNQERLAYYVSDFPCLTLKNHPRVIYLPHLGASTYEAEENCAVMIVKQVRDFLETGSITNAVNFPQVEMPHAGKPRIAIVNANIPNMVAQISAQLAAAKLNILDLINKSRDEIAYTLIDVNDAVNNDVLKEIAKIPGVVQVRHITV